MDLTTDKLRSLVRKWQSLIEAHVDVKTTDGYSLRMFAIGFTKRRPNQVRKTSYAQTSQIKKIRKKMMDIMTREASTCEMKALVDKLYYFVSFLLNLIIFFFSIPESIGKMMEKECSTIYPLQNVFVRKVKVLKMPKFDPYKLLELHGEVSSSSTAATTTTATTEDTGSKV